MSVHYDPRKAYVAADALSILSISSEALAEEKQGSSDGCSQSCSLGISPYEHIRMRQNRLW